MGQKPQHRFSAFYLFVFTYLFIFIYLFIYFSIYFGLGVCVCVFLKS